MSLGPAVSCPHQGRRLREAHGHMIAFIREYNTAIANFRPASFDGDLVLLQDAQHVARVGLALLTRKFQWLGQIPWLLVQADTRDGATQCLRQFDEVPVERHHRVSIEFCGRDGALRTLLEQVSEGSEVPDALRLEVRSLCLIPITEEKAEAVHREISHECKRTTSAGIPWHAASLRLQQNLKVATELCSSRRGQLEFDDLWFAYKRVVQTSQTRRGRFRPVRQKRALVSRKVYRIGEQGMVDFSWLTGTRVRDEEKDKTADAVKVHVEYLHAVLADKVIFSIPTLAEGAGDDGMKFIQVIDKPTSHQKFVKHIGNQLEGNLAAGLVLQPLEIWRRRSDQQFSVYCLEPPVLRDALKLAPWFKLRTRLLRWRAQASDADGCLEVLDPEPARRCLDGIALTAPACPLLVVMEQLYAMGWNWGNKRGPHRLEDDVKVLNISKGYSGRKAYFQAVLALPQLFDAGVVEVVRTGSNGYYRLLLTSDKPQEVVPGLPAERYQERLENIAEEGGVQVDVVLEAAPLELFPALQQPVEPIPIQDEEGIVVQPTEDVEVLDVSPDVLRDLLIDADEGGVVAAELGRACDVLAPEEMVVVVAPGDQVNEFPTHVEGVRIARETRVGVYDRLIVKCPRVEHGQCSRRRNCGAMQCRNFGKLEPVAFLALWLRQAQHIATKEEHMMYIPTVQDMHRWLEALEKSLLQVWPRQTEQCSSHTCLVEVISSKTHSGHVQVPSVSHTHSECFF